MDFLFGSKKATASATVDTKLRIQTAVAGKPIPVGCGQDRFAANIIWYGDFTATSQSVGGKGGVVGGGKGGGQQTNYTAAVLFALCEGPIASVVQGWDQQKPFPLSNIGATVLLGGYAQSPWGYLTTNHPTMADNYRGVSLIGLGPAQLGTSASLPNWSWEVLQTIANGIPGQPDADPRDWITNLLTNQYWSVHFPTGNLDALTSFSNWCKATGMVISDTLVSQQALTSYLQKLMEALCAEFVWSGGLLTIVPYGDVAITANGATYTPAAPLAGVSIGDDDFLPLQSGATGLSNQSRVQITRARAADFDNWVQVDYLDRSNSYNHAVAEAKDELQIELLGYANIKAGVRSYSFFKLQAAALASAHLQLGRQLVRNTYQFSLGRQWCFLDPMDILPITDSGAGLASKLVRIKEITEQQDGSFSIVAEEYLQGTATPYNYGSNSVASGPPICSDPGPTNYAVIDAPLCAAPGGPALIVAAGSPFTRGEMAIYLPPGTTSWLAPAWAESVTAECWGSGGDGSGGGGAYAKKYNIPITPGSVIACNVPVHGTNTVTGSQQCWFGAISTVRAQNGATNGGSGGQASNSVGDVVHNGGDSGGSSSQSGGGGGAAGPDGDGAKGGLPTNADGGGGGGGSDGGTVGALASGGHGGNGGANQAGLPGGTGTGANGNPGVNPGSGGGGSGPNTGNIGGNGADDPDKGGGGAGGGPNSNLGTGGNGGFPGGGGGGGRFGVNGNGAGGQIKLTFGSCNLWGSAILWVSTDGGTTYHQAATIPGPSPIGVLTATFPVGTDPDTTNSLQVDLSASQGALQSYANSDADAGRSRSMVGAELIDFTVATLTGTNKYTMGTRIRRGQLGTAIVSHSAGETFAQLGANSVVVKYPPSLIGTTIHFKFTALNTFGGFQQSLASVPDHTLVLVGPGSPSAPASLTVIEPVAASGSVSLSWPAAAGCGITGYNVNWNTGGADTVYLVNSNTLSAVISGLAAGAHNFKVQAVNSAGLVSAFTTTAFTVT